MAKLLHDEPPTSSIATALAESAALATRRPKADSEGPAEAPSAARHSEVDEDHPSVKREFVLTATTNSLIDELVGVVRAATGARVNSSTMARCIFLAVRNARGCIENQVERLGPMRLPAKGDHVRRRRFESAVTAALVAALRQASSFESDER